MSTLAAYCINLDHREDRWAECERNFAAQGLAAGIVQRWRAFEDREFGALGCARSHVSVLANFITERTEPYCLVLEDDFDFLRTWNDFSGTLNGLLQKGLDWDVLLLAGTSTVPYAENPPGVARVVESQSASGYLLQRRYVPLVLQCFSQSIVMLERFKGSPPREIWTIRFAIDQAWKQLQRVDRWFIMTPPIGHQRPSFSDIEQKNVDYSSQAYRGTQS